MKDNLTPEEKLLRLIRKDKGGPPGPERRSVTSSVEVIPKVALAAASSLEEAAHFSTIQKFIFLAFFGAGLYLAYSFLSPWFYEREFNLAGSALQQSPEAKFKPLPAAKPLELYLKGIQGSQIFHSMSAPEPAATPQAPASIHDMNLDFIKNVSLVGILTGDNPQAVIEDKKVQKTYYVSKGQSIGDFKVEEILEGKIILNYKGQKFELFL